MTGGYTGKTLRVDLTRGKASVEETDMQRARSFIGGRGYGGKLLFDEVRPGTDPLGPENKIILGTGPVSGTPLYGNSRAIIVTKSPETGGFLDTYSGGHFPAELKFAGYDFIVIEGRAARPTYIYIKDNEVQLRDAGHIWGRPAYETETTLKKEVKDDRARVAVIGPAGEKLSNIAIVQNDYYHEFGRGGTGAVFGSKNLKAIVVRGTQPVRIADSKRFVDYILKEVEPRLGAGGGGVGPIADRMKYGTPITLNFTNAAGILPTLNFRYGEFEGASKIDGHAFREKVIADTACFACTIGCTKHARSTTGPHAGTIVGGPEYETDGLLGANLGIADMDTIIYLNVLCDDLGLDVIGAGVVVGWAMECYEKGILSKSEVNGLDLRFGNAEAAAAMIRMIAYREGLGDILARGVKQAARAVGRGSEHFAMHVKGLEYAAYRPGPRSPGFGLNYAAVSERGACHRRGWPVIAEQKLEPFTTTGRAQLMKQLYDQRIPWHCACCCDIAILLSGLGHQDAANIFSTIIGWELTTADMQNLCERVACLLRVYNIREGMTRADDTLAGRSFDPDETGKAAGKALTREMLDTMLDEYYALRGWTKEGIPTRETLLKYGLSDAAAELDRYLKRGK